MKLNYTVSRYRNDKREEKKGVLRVHRPFNLNRICHRIVTLNPGWTHGRFGYHAKGETGMMDWRAR